MGSPEVKTIVQNKYENLLSSDDIDGTIAWLKKNVSYNLTPETVVITPEGDRYSAFDYLEKFDPNYATWNSLESTRSYDGGDDDE